MAEKHRVSRIFNLEKEQPSLDFVDVDISTDTAVFISPRALEMLGSEWGDQCVSLIQNFFEKCLDLIKEGKNVEAEKLLGTLKEPNETHLGLSNGRSRGRALGDGSAHEVWSALSNSAAAKSGLLKDLEDTVLLVSGIGVDIVSYQRALNQTHVGGSHRCNFLIQSCELKEVCDGLGDRVAGRL